MDKTITVEWKDWTGTTWNLTTGEQGVLLSENASDFGLPPINQILDASGNLTNTVLDPARPTLAVEVGIGLHGLEYYELANKWWSIANQPHKVGKLIIKRPGIEPETGEPTTIIREAEFVLREAPDVTWKNDPGLRQERAVEPWLLQGVSPYWDGNPQKLTYSRGTLTYYQPFYGKTGRWPLHITSQEFEGKKTFSNVGQGKMWGEWTFVGPLVNPAITYGNKTVSYRGSIPEGQTVKVQTDPRKVSAMNLTTGQNVLSKLYIPGSSFPSIPVGESVQISISAESATGNSIIEVVAKEQHLRPF